MLHSYKGTKKFGRVASRVARGALAVVLASTMAVSLGGCKDTDVLTEIAYTDDDALLSTDSVWNFLLGAPDNPNLPESTKNASQDIDEQKNDEATYDEDPNTEDNQTDQRDHKDDTDKDYNATSGDEAANKEGNNDQASNSAGLLAKLLNINATANSGGTSGSGGSTKSDTELAGKTTDTSDKSDSGATKDESESKDSGSGNSTGGDEGHGSSGDTTKGAEYDGTGTNTDLPHSGKIAACGQYALIVEMLGGKGTLAAADDVWLNSVIGTSAFPNEGLETVTVGWQGTSANLQAIVDSGAQVVLLERGTTYLSNSQMEQLMEAGVSVVHMPALGDVDTPHDDIVSAVTAVGEIMRVATNGSSSNMASTYVSMVLNTLRDVENANGGTSYKVSDGNTSNRISSGGEDSGTPAAKIATYNTAFIDSWTSFGASSFTGNQSWLGVGDFYLDGKLVDCSDGGGLSPRASSSARFGHCSLVDYYLQSAGIADQGIDGISLSDNPYLIYLASDEQHNLEVDEAISPRVFSNRGLWLCSTGSAYLRSNFKTVGDSDFPGCITRNETYADRIVASSQKTNGYYNAGQAYRVYVMPSGLAGSWADGTVESFLSAAWAYTWFQCYDNTSDRYSCESYFNDFYSTFYRCSFADAQSDGIVSGYGVVKQAGGQWL